MRFLKRSTDLNFGETSFDHNHALAMPHLSLTWEKHGHYIQSMLLHSSLTGVIRQKLIRSCNRQISCLSYPEQAILYIILLLKIDVSLFCYRGCDYTISFSLLGKCFHPLKIYRICCILSGQIKGNTVPLPYGTGQALNCATGIVWLKLPKAYPPPSNLKRSLL